MKYENKEINQKIWKVDVVDIVFHEVLIHYFYLLYFCTKICILSLCFFLIINIFTFTYNSVYLYKLINEYILLLSGGVIMYGALVLFEDEFIHIVAISFTALILTELIMVALTVRTWHYIILLAEILSLGLYLLSLIVFKDTFGKCLYTKFLYIS